MADVDSFSAVATFSFCQTVGVCCRLFVNVFHFTNMVKFVPQHKKRVPIMQANVKQPGHQDTGLIHVQWFNNGLYLKHK